MANGNGSSVLIAKSLRFRCWLWRLAMGKAAVAVELTVPELRELQSLARAHRTGQAMARRARIAHRVVSQRVV